MACGDRTSCSQGGYDIYAVRSDSVDLPRAVRGVYATSGDLKVTTIDGSVVTFSAFGGGILPIEIKRLWSTGTTATSVIGLY